MVCDPDMVAVHAGIGAGGRHHPRRGFIDAVSHVWGVFRDNVEGVTAIVDGQDRPVTLGESTFLYEGTSLPSDLVLQLANGNERPSQSPRSALRSTTPTATTRH